MEPQYHSIVKSVIIFVTVLALRCPHGLGWCDYQFSVPLLRESLQLPLLSQ